MTNHLGYLKFHLLIVSALMAGAYTSLIVFFFFNVFTPAEDVYHA